MFSLMRMKGLLSGLVSICLPVLAWTPGVKADYQEVQLLSDWGIARVDAQASSDSGEILGEWSDEYAGTLRGLTSLHLDKALETDAGYGWLDGAVAPRSNLLSGQGLEVGATTDADGLALWARSEATFSWKWRIGHESVPFWAAGFAEGGLLDFRLNDLTADTQPISWQFDGFGENSVELKLTPYHEYELQIHSLAEAEGLQDPRAWAEFAFDAVVHAPEPTSLMLLLVAAGPLVLRPRLSRLKR